MLYYYLQVSSNKAFCLKKKLVIKHYVSYIQTHLGVFLKQNLDMNLLIF